MQKLNSCMESYLETVLRVSADREYVDVQAIVRDKDKTHLLRMVFALLLNL